MQHSLPHAAKRWKQVKKMRKRLFHKLGERGQSLVELALVFPVVLIIMAAVFDVGRVLDASIVLTNAVRTGARFGSTHPTWYDSIRMRVVDFANDSGMSFTDVHLDGSNVDVMSGGGAGGTIRVVVNYDVPMTFARAIGLDTLHIQRAAEMLILVSP